MVAVTGAIEITVHGWDIAVACGRARPACPGDELVAFLGRRPFRGDSEGSAGSA